MGRFVFLGWRTAYRSYRYALAQGMHPTLLLRFRRRERLAWERLQSWPSA